MIRSFRRFYKNVKILMSDYTDSLTEKKTDIRAMFFLMLFSFLKGVKQYFTEPIGKKGKRRRLPVVSLSLLLFLFCLNIFLHVSPSNQTVSAKNAQVTTSSHSVQITTSMQQTTTEQKNNATTSNTSSSASTRSSQEHTASSSASSADGDVQSATQSEATTAQCYAGQFDYTDQASPCNKDPYLIAPVANPNFPLTSSDPETCTGAIDPNQPTWTDYQEVTIPSWVTNTNPDIQYYCRHFDIQAQQWMFPCMASNADASVTGDWLSGEGGRFEQTNPADTYQNSYVNNMTVLTKGIAFVLMMPIFIMVGYQMLLGLSSFQMAGAFESISRIVMGAVAVLVSSAFVALAVSFADSICTAIVGLHGSGSFTFTNLPLLSETTNNGTEVIGYVLPNDAAADSYRGLIMPITKWGCSLNDFAGVLSPNLVTGTLENIVPLFGNFVGIFGTVSTMFEVVHNVGELLITIFSAILCAQVVIRIFLLNYYIVTAPLAFGCWGLPGGVGQNVVRLWWRGFISTLFVQMVQLFVISTLPYLMPNLNLLVSANFDKNLDLINPILALIPPLLVLWMTTKVPRLLGASISSVFTQAGQMVGSAVSAAGMVAYNM